MKRFVEKARSLLSSDPDPEDSALQKDLALAVLLLQCADADHDLSPRELERIVTELCQAFALSAEDARALLAQARSESETAVSLHAYVNRLKKDSSPQQRLSMVSALWRVVAADQRIDPHEGHLVKRLGNLLGVTQSAVMQALHQAQDSGSAQ